MKILSNYVKVLDVMDCRKAAWQTSRPKFTEENLHFDKVADMDLSLNSMLVYTLEMRSSVIFRDLIFSLRPLEGWALSTRSMPITRDTICLAEEFGDMPAEYECIREMFDLLEDGVSRDQARDKLPLSVSSTYTFTIDFRVLMSFCKTIQKIDPDLFGIYCYPMLKATGNLETYLSTSVASAEDYYMIHPDEMTGGLQKSGNMMIGHYSMKMAMASQFLRQHYSKIKIGLWNKIAEEGYYNMGLRQRDMIDVAFYIDVKSYDRLMSMRSHWVLDHSPDMWGTIVGDYIKDMTPEEFWEFTPAGGDGKDPYWADCYNRVLLEDPGIPCPIMTEWKGAIDARRLEIGDNIILDKYESLFDGGIVKDNWNNEHRVLYFKNLEENNCESNTGVEL